MRSKKKFQLIHKATGQFSIYAMQLKDISSSTLFCLYDRKFSYNSYNIEREFKNTIENSNEILSRVAMRMLVIY